MLQIMQIQVTIIGRLRYRLLISMHAGVIIIALDSELCSECLNSIALYQMDNIQVLE